MENGQEKNGAKYHFVGRILSFILGSLALYVSKNPWTHPIVKGIPPSLCLDQFFPPKSLNHVSGWIPSSHPANRFEILP
jgi:hypothetical protein